MSTGKLVLALAGGIVGWIIGAAITTPFVPSERNVWGLCGVVVGCFVGMKLHDARR